MVYQCTYGSPLSMTAEEKTAWYDRVYERETQIFQRYVTPNPLECQIYLYSPSFSVATLLDPPIPGGILASLDELQEIILLPVRQPGNLATLE